MRLTKEQRLVKKAQRDKVARLVDNYMGSYSLREFAAEWNELLPEENHISYQSIANWRNGVYVPDPESVLPVIEHYKEGETIRKLAERLLRIIDGVTDESF